MSTVCLNLVAPLYVIAICTVIISQLSSRRQFITLVVLETVLIASGISILAIEIKLEGAVYHLIYGFAYFSLESSGHFDPDFMDQVRLVISCLNILSFIAPVFVLLAAASILASPENGRKTNAHHKIAAQMRQMKDIINTGSALLVSGIIHTNAWLQWPITLVPDPQICTAFSEIAIVIVLFWGTTFTLLLFMIAAPSITYLSRKAETLSQLEFQAGRIPIRRNGLKKINYHIPLVNNCRK